MDLIKKQIEEYNYFSKIILLCKYIEIYVPDLFCCTYHYKKIFYELEPSLILLYDSSDGTECLLIHKEYFINAINEIYNTIFENNDSLSIVSKIYKNLFL